MTAPAADPTEEARRAFLDALDAVSAAHDAYGAALARGAPAAELAALFGALELARGERQRRSLEFMQAFYAAGPKGATLA